MNLQEQLNRIQSMMGVNDCNYELLNKIADKLADTMYCDRFGSCVHFAELFTEKVNEVNPNLLNCFKVVEGYVDWEYGDDIPQQHTWIELNNGEKIDPTFEQFTKYGWANFSNKRAKRFTGLDYYEETIKGTWFSDKRKKFPEHIFKN
jgi:hypothetical protein